MMRQILRQRSIQVFLLAALMLLSSSWASAQVAGHIDRVWVEHDVKVKGETGIRIHTDFSVKNAVNVECAIQANLQRADGLTLSFNANIYSTQGGKQVLVSSYNTYATKDGKAVLISKPFTPPYNSANYSDSKLFFPYWALNLREQNANKMTLLITVSSGAKEFLRSATLDISQPLGKAN